MDIMKDFKDTRFYIMPNDFDYYYKHIAVLCDLSYWNTHFNDLRNWCDENECEVLGMTVNIPDDQRVVLFLLRWS